MDHVFGFPTGPCTDVDLSAVIPCGHVEMPGTQGFFESHFQPFEALLDSGVGCTSSFDDIPVEGAESPSISVDEARNRHEPRVRLGVLGRLRRESFVCNATGAPAALAPLATLPRWRIAWNQKQLKNLAGPPGEIGGA
jgi:hypothetical protein